MQRESFGPILPGGGYAAFDEVVVHIKAGARPPALYRFSHDRATPDRRLTRLMSGGVSIDDALFRVGQHDLRFGGVGDSGTGHCHVQEGSVTFSRLRPVFHHARRASTALVAPPDGKLAARILMFPLK